ncbi:alpha/beta hydrolase [Schleiferilactobacillus harbinensis]|uniref:Alpha/beta hydrolase n=1 Tax=Schleiferilactobacillus harbinensis TaxID=304207 RepID=A0ABU7SYC5_9LACO
MQKRTKLLIVSLSAVIIVLALGGIWFRQRSAGQVQYARTTTPTLFLHGWGSSYHAEEHMTNAAKQAGVTDTIIRADVDRQGRVTLIGTIPAKAKNPIVEVGYADNKNTQYHTDGRWLRNVLTTLQAKYRITKFNVAGHSMGNMAIAFYLLDNAGNTRLPQLQKQVDIAGHFNGILGLNDAPNRMKLRKTGQPTVMDADYKELLGLRTKYPRDQVDVLNIYGDKNDGTHSDGDVSNASSQSLRYLIADRAKSYQEKKIVGPDAQHSKLHENPEVDRLLIKFLWQ